MEWEAQRRREGRSKKKRGKKKSCFFYLLFSSAVKCQESFKIMEFKVKQSRKPKIFIVMGVTLTL